MSRTDCICTKEVDRMFSKIVESSKLPYCFNKNCGKCLICVIENVKMFLIETVKNCSSSVHNCSCGYVPNYICRVSTDHVCECEGTREDHMYYDFFDFTPDEDDEFSSYTFALLSLDDYSRFFAFRGETCRSDDDSHKCVCKINEANSKKCRSHVH